MNINEYVRMCQTFDWNGTSTVIDPVRCHDGFTMSVQASRFHYCSPRLYGIGEYTELEVGFPNMDEETLFPYSDGGSVYAYVPVSVIDAIIEKHGGIANIKR